MGTRHEVVPPTPVAVSYTAGPGLCADARGPIAPPILMSGLHFTWILEEGYSRLLVLYGSVPGRQYNTKVE